jgi:hypothetical protein
VRHRSHQRKRSGFSQWIVEGTRNDGHTINLILAWSGEGTILGRTLRAWRVLYPLQIVSSRVVILSIRTNIPETAVDYIEPPNVVCSSQQVRPSENASKLPKSSKRCLYRLKIAKHTGLERC